jgi:hypothetical protein
VGSPIELVCSFIFLRRQLQQYLSVECLVLAQIDKTKAIESLNKYKESLLPIDSSNKNTPMDIQEIFTKMEKMPAMEAVPLPQTPRKKMELSKRTLQKY